MDFVSVFALYLALTCTDKMNYDVLKYMHSPVDVVKGCSSLAKRATMGKMPEQRLGEAERKSGHHSWCLHLQLFFIFFTIIFACFEL